jgi:hypothetical protein
VTWWKYRAYSSPQANATPVPIDGAQTAVSAGAVLASDRGSSFLGDSSVADAADDDDEEHDDDDDDDDEAEAGRVGVGDDVRDDEDDGKGGDCSGRSQTKTVLDEPWPSCGPITSGADSNGNRAPFIARMCVTPCDANRRRACSSAASRVPPVTVQPSSCGVGSGSITKSLRPIHPSTHPLVNSRGRATAKENANVSR